jgi:DNA-binding response OmpR family regulator
MTMIRKVLIVDDDQEMLLALKEGLSKYNETFSIDIAADGMYAVEKLKNEVISLVVTDLKMPRMDGFTLLSHIMEHYPDIPVIIVTAYSTTEMEKLAREGGAVGYIAKPFIIEDLARRVITTLRKEADGGTLHSVSSGMFLQLMEMEQKTCTIRLAEKGTQKNGVLFFRDGELLDARVDNQQGIEAAYEIFSWDEVTLSIQNDCLQKENLIQSELQPIILEAMRRKDEAQEAQLAEDASVETEPVEGIIEDQEVIETSGTTAKKSVNVVEALKAKLDKKIGQRSGIEDVYRDSSWNTMMKQLMTAGSIFDTGDLKLAYVDKNDRFDYILLPGESTTVITTNPKSPKEKIIRALVKG